METLADLAAALNAIKPPSTQERAAQRREAERLAALRETARIERGEPENYDPFQQFE